MQSIMPGCYQQCGIDTAHSRPQHLLRECLIIAGQTHRRTLQQGTGIGGNTCQNGAKSAEYRCLPLLPWCSNVRTLAMRQYGLALADLAPQGRLCMLHRPPTCSDCTRKHCWQVSLHAAKPAARCELDCVQACKPAEPYLMRNCLASTAWLLHQPPCEYSIAGSQHQAVTCMQVHVPVVPLQWIPVLRQVVPARPGPGFSCQ